MRGILNSLEGVNLSHDSCPRASLCPQAHRAKLTDILIRNQSYATVQKMMTDDLEFQKLLPSEDHKRHRLEVFQRLFERFQQEGDAFLDRIVTWDET